jgi:DNA-binding MarR family transcriptional regulator
MTIRSRIAQRQFKHAAEEALVSLLVAAGQYGQRLNDLCREHGITHDQYNILRILRGVHPEGHPRFEIAKRLVSRAPDVTRLIDRLERQGLVARGWSSENRRHSIATITKDGLDVLAAIEPELDALQRRATAGLTLDDLDTCTRVCNHVAGE